MENLAQKEQFLRSGFVVALKTINPDTAPIFGKMNPQQMLEHMAEYIRFGYGNPIITQVFYTSESLEKVRQFVMSEHPFRDNTPNPILSEIPKPVRFSSYQAALEDVEIALNELFTAFENNKELEVASPFFGMLDYKMSIQLLHKHAQHHLRQFGVPGLS